MMISQVSPQNAGMIYGITSDFPELQKVSDVVFLQWQAVAGNYLPRINCIISYSITNRETPAAISRALGNSPYAYWPGSTYTMDTEEGQALLGTPNGAGVGFMLSRHKAQLGIKTVSSVSVFGHRCPWMGNNPVLLFRVEI